MHPPPRIWLRNGRLSLTQTIILAVLALAAGVAIGHALPAPSRHDTFALAFDRPVYGPRVTIRFTISGDLQQMLQQRKRFSFSLDRGCRNWRYPRQAWPPGLTMQRTAVNIFAIYPYTRGRLGYGRHTLCLYSYDQLAASASLTLAPK